MTDVTQPIRDALAAFETADSYRDYKEAVCNFHDALTRSKVIALLARLDAAELDSKRLEWIKAQFFTSHWNGVVDSGSRTTWQVAGYYRHAALKMTTNGLEPDFRAGIDAAIKVQP